MRNPIQLTVVSIFIALLALVCGCSQQSRKDGHLKKADGYFAASQYDKAEIEYMNVLQIDPLDPQSISRIGIIYAEQGRLSQVMPYLLKARELQPDNLTVRVKLAMLYLSAGNPKLASEEASFVLDRNPRDPDAPVILAESAGKPEEIAAARQRLRALPAPAADSAPVLVALGTLDMREKHPKEAESAFRKALEKEPKSSVAMTAMGAWYALQNDRPQAEQAFKQAAEWSAPRSPRQLLYAKYLIQEKQTEAARQALEAITAKTPDFLPALFLQAEIAANDKKFSESSALVAKILAQDPAYPEALLLNARLLLAGGEKAKAAALMERMLKTYPKSPQAHFQLGMIRYTNNEIEAAIASLTQAVSLAPGYAEPAMLLAEIQLKGGNGKTAIDVLKPLTQKRPDLVQARLMLADAYRNQGDLPEALEIYEGLAESFPQSSQIGYGKGVILMLQKKHDAARQAFAKTLELAPDYLPALEQLIGFDLAEKNYAAATRRVDAQVARDPKIAGPYLLRAKIALAQANTKDAETAFLKAIELQPDSSTAYLLLARLYAATKQQDKALANFQEVTAKNPRNIEALMMTATLQGQQRDFAAARENFEKVLALNPKFFPALNDLAYLYAEHLNQLDKGQELAQKALEISPHEPHAADTLGWILFKKRQYSWALTQLLAAAAKLPDSAEIQYHLGMTHYMLGETEPARAAFKRALELDPAFAEKATVQDRLALLETQPQNERAGMREKLEQAVKERPDDPIALTRLAAIYAREGALEKAIAAYRSALEASPKNIPAMVALARLYLEHKETDQALELAKNARKLAPDDAAVAQTLGRLAYQTGDYAWSLSLLQEASRKNPDDPALLHDLALAAYSVGRLDDAETAMQRAAKSPGFSGADDARRFLAMTALAANPAPAGQDQVERILKDHPDYVPALMAKAAISEKKFDSPTAVGIYERVLKLFPGFTPAKKQLVIWYANNPGDDQKAATLANSARETLNKDAEFTKAYGIIVYRTGDYARAATLLRDAVAERTKDAEAFYYLGAAQAQLKRIPESRRSLQQALDLNLKPSLATEAGKLLAELK